MARGICVNCVHHSVGYTGAHRCNANEYKIVKFDYVTGITKQVGGESDGKVSCYVKKIATESADTLLLGFLR